MSISIWVEEKPQYSIHHQVERSQDDAVFVFVIFFKLCKPKCRQVAKKFRHYFSLFFNSSKFFRWFIRAKICSTLRNELPVTATKKMLKPEKTLLIQFQYKSLSNLETSSCDVFFHMSHLLRNYFLTAQSVSSFFFLLFTRIRNLIKRRLNRERKTFPSVESRKFWHSPRFTDDNVTSDYLQIIFRSCFFLSSKEMMTTLRLLLT